MTSAEMLWTIEDVVGYIGIPVRTLYHWRVKGKGPVGTRIGKHIRYVPEDVKTWFSEQRGD